MVGQDSGQVSQTESHALLSHTLWEATPPEEPHPSQKSCCSFPKLDPMTKFEFMKWGGLVRENYCYCIANKNLNSTFIWRYSNFNFSYI